MKVLEHYDVPFESIPDFLADCIHKKIKIKSITETSVEISIEQDYTEAEFNMDVLLAFRNSDASTFEEKNAIDYAIGAIKTLIDMGVIKYD